MNFLALLSPNKTTSHKARTQQNSTVLEELMRVGYFDYVTEDDTTEALTELTDCVSNYGTIGPIYRDNSAFPIDNKTYWCDAENLYESGGIIEALEIAQHAFETRGLRLSFWKGDDKTTEKHWKHMVTVNYTEYVAYDDTRDNPYAWAIAQCNFYEILNDQLAAQGSSERVYSLMGGTNDAMYTLLTPEQFEIIDAHLYTDSPSDKPIPVELFREQIENAL